MKSLKSVWLLSFFVPILCMAQKIDNAASFRDIKSDRYIRFHYDNDFFISDDEDYSQGCNLELVTPWLKKNPINHILISPKNSEIKYGFAMEHIVFTPDSLVSYEIVYGQRPFAAAFTLKSFTIATDTIHKSKISSSLSIGIIGQGVGGGNMQKWIHQITSSQEPNGWYYQIKNDLVLNYDISYEKQLLRLKDYFSLNGNANLKIGTLFTNASIGLTASLGIINSPFTSVKNNNKFQLYLYSQPLINVIGYDATLQGGVFNDKSPYTIPSGNIERFTLQDNLGIVLQTGRFYFEYSHTLLTREINTIRSHNWGGFRIGYEF
jgi:lipid A 3-O-deacylase